MTNTEILNQKVQEILGSRYEVKTNNGISFFLDGYKMGTTLVLGMIGEKAGLEVKKEIAKLCLRIQFSMQ